jgi:hypothetical protein
MNSSADRLDDFCLFNRLTFENVIFDFSTCIYILQAKDRANIVLQVFGLSLPFYLLIMMQAQGIKTWHLGRGTTK